MDFDEHPVPCDVTTDKTAELGGLISYYYGAGNSPVFRSEMHPGCIETDASWVPKVYPDFDGTTNLGNMSGSGSWLRVWTRLRLLMWVFS